MSTRRRTASVLLGLLVVLATVFGVACLCAHGPGVRPTVAVASSSYDVPDHLAREHLCALPGQDHCGAKTTAATPTTGPGNHPFPQTLPTTVVDARPATAAPPVRARPAAPRPPGLHALQVLRT
ncbi:hypothetical protein [Streptomyces olivaceoviridis]|uniref:hypothetical protein n=1 Tax=Streptomyces olivaceoviridis TaxID=1921 RepID=UPI0036F79074